MAISAALLLVGFASWWWRHDPAPVPLPGSGAAAAAPVVGIRAAGTGRGRRSRPNAPPVLGDRVPAEAQGEQTVRGIRAGAWAAVRWRGDDDAVVRWVRYDGRSGPRPRASSAIPPAPFVWRGPARSQPGLVTVVAPAQPIKLWCEPELVFSRATGGEPVGVGAGPSTACCMVEFMIPRGHRSSARASWSVSGSRRP